MILFTRYNAWVINLSFFFAIVLQIIPWSPNLYVFYPSWLNLVLIYWSIKLPNRINVGTGFILGLIMDLILSPVLGVRALALSVVSYITTLKSRILHSMNPCKQALTVFLLSLVHQLIICCINFLIINTPVCPKIFLNSIVNGMIWPWLFLFMRKIHYRYSI